MGTPLQSILNGGIGQERNSGENRKSASIAAEPVKFNIISVFEDGTGKVDFKPENIRQLTEGKLLQLFPQNPADDLEIPFLSQTEEWHRSLEKKELLAPKPPGTTATLNIIYVNNDEDFFHGMSPDTLPKLFKIFWLDISALHLLGRSVDTWHCIRRDEICNFLFIIQGLYRIACSFSPKGRETNCVVFGVPPKRVVDGLGNFNFYFYRPAWFCEQSPSSHERRDNQSMLDKQITFEPSRAFPDLLANIESYHLHHPLSLACFGLLDSLVSISLRVGDEIGPTTDLENKVTAPIGEDEKTLNSLVSLSKKAGRASVTMARLSRVTGVASMLLQTLQDRKGWKRWCRGFFPTSSGSQYDRAAEWLAENLPSRSQWLQNEKLQIQSQDERVKALTPIVSWGSPEIIPRKRLQRIFICKNWNMSSHCTLKVICAHQSCGRAVWSNDRSYDNDLPASNVHRRHNGCALGPRGSESPNSSGNCLLCGHIFYDSRGISHLDEGDNMV